MEDQPENRLSVRHDSAGKRFVVESEGHLAQLIYQKEPGRLILVHTEVPEELGGRGIAGQLVRTAVASAASEQRTIVPWCPYARRWLQDHQDVAGSVTVDWEDRPKV
jgi:predicted GNAT family acetyltransferase